MKLQNYPAYQDGPLHRHDFSLMLLVVGGAFTLALEERAISYRPGEMCELAAAVMHTERAGPAGAQVLLARRGPTAAGAGP